MRITIFTAFDMILIWKIHIIIELNLVVNLHRSQVGFIFNLLNNILVNVAYNLCMELPKQSQVWIWL